MQAPLQPGGALGGLCLIGGGSLGFAVAHRCLQQGIVAPQSLMILEHKSDRCDYLRLMLPGVVVTTEVSALCTAQMYSQKLQALMICVKPQEFHTVIDQIKPLVQTDALIISPMAGVALGRVASAFENHRHVVRCMPNLGALHGLSMTVYYCSAAIGELQKDAARYLFEALGKCLEVDSDTLIDAATAVNGSGPAYMFYLVEKLEEAASELGFTAAQSELLVRQTLLAAHALLDRQGASASALRDQVTSRGGTTEAAFKLFDERQLGKTLSEGIKQAFEKARALSVNKG